MKRWIICLLVLATAGVANAIWWTPTNSPPGVGYWNDIANWGANSDGSAPLNRLPEPDEKTQFSSNPANVTECVVTNTVSCGQLVLGDGGSNEGVLFRIAAGGTLNAKSAGGSWVGLGYSRDVHTVIEAGGLLNAGTRIGVGMVGGTSLLEVYGDVVAAPVGGLSSGAFQVSNGGGNGTVMLYHGATLTAHHLEMAGSSALIDVWGDAVVTLTGGVYTNQVAAFIADGKIRGNRLTNNLDYVLDVPVPGETNTVITAIASVPSLEGLTLPEVTNTLAAFGYTVGSISYGFVAGAVTDRVIGQSPAAGSAPLNPGDPVDVVLQELSVPNLVGMSLADATTLLESIGLTTGVVTEVYIFDTPVGEVLDQDPAAGSSATTGDAIDVTAMESLLNPDNTVIIATKDGDWMSSTNWDLSITPWKETQNYQVQIPGGRSMTLTNFVAVRRTHQGHNGVGAAELTIKDGGHLVTALVGGDVYGAVGWNADAVLNVYTNGIYESRKALRIGWAGSSGIINIDGGTVLVANEWISMGRETYIDPGTGTNYMSEINIKNGGSMLVNYVRSGLYRYGKITIAEGSFATTGTSTGDITDGLNEGWIVMADGYTPVLGVVDGNYTISGFKPGYESWAKSWEPDVIGSETDDYDGDLVLNVAEYGLNGDPTDDQDTGEAPVLVNNGGVLEYSHLSRADDTNLVYTVETKTDLTGGSWLPTGSSVLSTNVTGGYYNVVTNVISSDVDTRFIRINISNP